MGADRNLLLGILALQNSFITRDQLVTAMNDWVLERQTPLADLLERKGFLDPDCRALLDALVDKQIDRHQGNVEASIAALSSVAEAKAALNEVPDDEVRSLAMTLRPLHGEAASTQPLLGTSSDRQGRFTIVRPHAAGGLGEVFVARDNELDREVALKQIRKQYSENAHQQSRFKLEAEVTGGLEHPGIVPIYSLGSYADGRPFYAMRFIRGDSLKEAVDRFHGRLPGSGSKAAGSNRRSAKDFASLEFRGLLRRFVDVCNAIAYAHSRGVLHRDLKPGNIMLGKFGETLVVDWGLAKALGKAPTETSRDASLGPLVPPSASGSGFDATAPGSTIGTPAYMSPEQAEGRLEELGPATDVYSLGATLYTALTGQPPFSGKAVIEILEKVRTGDYPAVRQVQPAAPRALEAVCAKAMALKPADRYPTASELATELERWLADEPVKAWREPAAIRAKRWVRKHAAFAAGISAALFVGTTSLAAGFFMVSRAYENERQAKELARENAKKAETAFRRAKAAIDEYFTDVSQSRELAQKYPGMHEFRIKLLEKAQKYYEEFLKDRGDDPALQFDAAKAFFNRAFVANETGRAHDAKSSYLQSLAIFEKLAGDHPTITEYADKLASAHNNLGNLHSDNGNLNEAMSCLRKALEIREKLARENTAVPEYASGLADTLHNLANLYRATGDAREAMAAFRRALEIYGNLERAHPGNAKNLCGLASTHRNLGILQHLLGDANAAIASSRRAVDIYDALARNDSAITEYANLLAGALNSLGVVQQSTGDLNGAITSLQRALQIQEKLARENPAVTEFVNNLASTQHNLGVLQRDIGGAKGAMASWQKALEIREKLAADNPSATEYATGLANTHNNLGVLQRDLGDIQSAMASWRKALQIQERLARENPTVAKFADGLASAHHNLGSIQRETGDFKEALASFRRSLKICEELARDNPAVAEYANRLATTHSSLGLLHEALGEANEAMASYQKAQEIRERLMRRHPTVTAYANGLAATHNNLATLLFDAGDANGALTNWQKALEIREKLAHENPSNVEFSANLAGSYCNLGALFLDIRSPAESLEYFEKALNVSKMHPSSNPTSRHVQRSSHWGKARALTKLERYDEAIANFDAALALDNGSAAKEIQAERDAVLAKKKAKDDVSKSSRGAASPKENSQKSGLRDAKAPSTKSTSKVEHRTANP